MGALQVAIKLNSMKGGVICTTLYNFTVPHKIATLIPSHLSAETTLLHQYFSFKK